MSYFWHTPTTKPLPNWLFYLLFWLIIPPAIVAMMAWFSIINPLWLTVTHTRPHRGGEE